MSLTDDINALPNTIEAPASGHTQDHETIHAALKAHNLQSRDTGWRDITSLLSPSPSSGSINIRRTGHLLHLRFYYLTYSSGVSATYHLPSGWYTKAHESVRLLSSNAADVGRLVITSAGDLTVFSDSDAPITGTVALLVDPSTSWPAASPA